MKTKITSISGIFLLLLFLCSCKKDSFEKIGLPVDKHDNLAELKQYFFDEVAEHKRLLKPSEFIPDYGDIQWDKAVSFDDQQRVLVPVNMNARKTSKTLLTQKYLVLSKTGNIKNATFYYLITDLSKANPVSNLLGVNKLLNKEIVEEAKNIADVESTIIYRVDLPDVFKSEKQNSEFRNGRNGKFVNFKLLTQYSRNSKDVDTTSNNNFQTLESCTASGGSMVEIEWWYQIYVNGVLVYEEYVYSTFQCIGGVSGGSGGGGTGGTPTNACITTLTNFSNAGSSVSQLVSENIQEQPLKKTIFYNWRFYHALTWGLVSYEKVDFERRSERLGWVFKSYSSLGDASVGSSIGGTRTYRIISRVAEDKGYAALITIDFSVTHKAMCPANVVLPTLTTLHQSKVLIKAGPMQIIYDH